MVVIKGQIYESRNLDWIASQARNDKSHGSNLVIASLRSNPEHPTYAMRLEDGPLVTLTTSQSITFLLSTL